MFHLPHRCFHLLDVKSSSKTCQGVELCWVFWGDSTRPWEFGDPGETAIVSSFGPIKLDHRVGEDFSWDLKQKEIGYSTSHPLSRSAESCCEKKKHAVTGLCVVSSEHPARERSTGTRTVFEPQRQRGWPICFWDRLSAILYGGGMILKSVIVWCMQ